MRERKAVALAAQEMVLAVWMTASGFRPVAVSTTSERADGGTLAGVQAYRGEGGSDERSTYR
ncbi:MAG TPA: hypothetical protein VF391_15230 [Dermatophilaceae bacterium]